MIQVASCEQALIKRNRKPIKNHRNKTMILFKTYTLKIEFDRHLKQMDSYQGTQSVLPLLLVGEFGAFEILCKMTVLQSLIFHISLTGSVKI